MELGEAIAMYRLDAMSRRLSKNTLIDYGGTFRKFLSFAGEHTPFESITADTIRQFLASLECSKKSVLNAHTALSSLWTWAVKSEHLASHNIVHGVRAPKPEIREVDIFSEQDIRAMLRTSTRVTYTRQGKRVTFKLPQARRNRAIILILLDTGVRASELCNCKIGDCDLRNLRLRVMGKGSKERFIRFDAVTGKAIWRYLSSRPNRVDGDWLIVTDDGRKMNRSELAVVVRRIGERAGVKAYPHKWRHTYATMALDNGMSDIILQDSLGHSSSQMVRRYVHKAQLNKDRLQSTASPVRGLGL